MRFARSPGAPSSYGVDRRWVFFSPIRLPTLGFEAASDDPEIIDSFAHWAKLPIIWFDEQGSEALSPLAALERVMGK